MKGGGHTIALHLALENVGREVEMLTRKAHAIDEALGDAICAVDVLEALPLELTQDVDLMRQSADCVTILLKNLAMITRQKPGLNDLLDADAVTEGVYLSVIRDRVTAAPMSANVAPIDEEGWIDL